MLVQQHIATPSEWQTGIQVWNIFTERRPELGLRPGKWAFHNFLRAHRQALKGADAIRLVRNRFWLAHVERFCAVAFECATGHFSPGMSPAGLPVVETPVHAEPLKPQLIQCNGRSLDGYWREHGQLPPHVVGQLIEQNTRLLSAVDAVIEAWPAWMTGQYAANDVSMDPLKRVSQALQQIHRGQK